MTRVSIGMNRTLAWHVVLAVGVWFAAPILGASHGAWAEDVADPMAWRVGEGDAAAVVRGIREAAVLRGPSDVLLPWLDDPREDVASEAALALGRCGLSETSRKTLEAVALDPGRSPVVRTAVVFSLTTTREDATSEQTLLQMLQIERHPQVVVEVILALGRVGQASSVDALAARASLADPARWRERAAALHALGTLAVRFGPYLPERASQVVVEALSASDPEVRAAAAWALSQAPSRAAETALWVLMESSSSELRNAAARALEYVEWTAVDFALQLLARHDESLTVRTAIARGLVRQSAPSSQARVLAWVQSCLLSHASSEGQSFEIGCEPVVVAAALQVWLAEDRLDSWMRASLAQVARAREGWLDRRFGAGVAPGTPSFHAHLSCLLAAVLDVGGGQATLDCGPEAVLPTVRKLYRIEALRFRSDGFDVELGHLAADPDPAVRATALTALSSRVGLRPEQVSAALRDEDSRVAGVAVRYLAQEGASAAPHAEALESLVQRLDPAGHAAIMRDVMALLRRLGRSDAVRINAALPRMSCDGGPNTGSTRCANEMVAANSPSSGLTTRPRGAVLVTDGGVIELRFRWASAPVAVQRWVGRASRGEYDGMSFHAAVPGLAVFGGGAKGDGRGPHVVLESPEVRPIFVREGAVGLVTDSHGQVTEAFFLSLADQPQLYGEVPLIADVVRGMDVAHRLMPGDRVLHVRLLADAVDARADSPGVPVPLSRGLVGFGHLVH